MVLLSILLIFLKSWMGYYSLVTSANGSSTALKFISNGPICNHGVWMGRGDLGNQAAGQVRKERQTLPAFLLKAVRLQNT